MEASSVLQGYLFFNPLHAHDRRFLLTLLVGGVGRVYIVVFAMARESYIIFVHLRLDEFGRA